MIDLTFFRYILSWSLQHLLFTPITNHLNGIHAFWCWNCDVELHICYKSNV